MGKYFTIEEAELFQFYRIPKALMNGRYKKLSFGAKFLYGMFLDRNSLSAKNNWVDDKGIFIIYTIEEIMKDLNVSDKTATKLINELKNHRLVEIKRRGQGNPNKIYVLRFISDKSKKEPVESIEKTKNRKISDSKKGKFPILNQENLRCNNTEYNNTEYNNNNRDKENININVNEKEIGVKKHIEKKDIDVEEFKGNDSSIDLNKVENIQKKFEQLGEINKKKIKELITKHGEEKINHYVSNFDNLANGYVKNPIGFLITAIENEWKVPKAKINNNYNKPIQSTNFDQRQYTDEEFEEFYENYEP